VPEPKRGEVWRVDFNPAVGREQGEIRPALVLSVDAMNDEVGRSIVLPFTKTLRDLPSWLPVEPPEGGISKASSILCDQIRAVSHERFSEKMGELSTEVLEQVETVVKRLLGFK